MTAVQTGTWKCIRCDVLWRGRPVCWVCRREAAVKRCLGVIMANGAPGPEYE